MWLRRYLMSIRIRRALCIHLLIHGKNRAGKKAREDGEAIVRETILKILNSRFEILNQHFEETLQLIKDKLEICQLEDLNKIVRQALEAFSLDDFIRHLPEDEPETV